MLGRYGEGHPPWGPGPAGVGAAAPPADSSTPRRRAAEPPERPPGRFRAHGSLLVPPPTFYRLFLLLALLLLLKLSCLRRGDPRVAPTQTATDLAAAVVARQGLCYRSRSRRRGAPVGRPGRMSGISGTADHVEGKIGDTRPGRTQVRPYLDPHFGVALARGTASPRSPYISHYAR